MMKPLELLKYIEEASGTTLYEKKKTESQNIIKRKQNKVEELGRIMQQEIGPQMIKLKEDRENLTKFRINESESQQIMKKLIAYEYFNNTKVVEAKEK